MPVTVDIEERTPPQNVVLDAKKMSKHPDNMEARLRPHDDGWEVVAKTGREASDTGPPNNDTGPPNNDTGPPERVQNFLDDMRKNISDDDASITQKPSNNELSAVYPDRRFE